MTVAGQRTFTGAADALGIPQPLLSRRIKNLEREWGTQILDRSARGAGLTPCGELLLPYAQDLVERARHLDRVAASVSASLVRVIGVPPECPPSALARIIRAAADRSLQVNMQEAPARARAAGLEAGTLAAALLRVPAGSGPLTVRTGLAARDGRPPGRRLAHFDTLRPRRTAPAGGPVTLLLVPEDDVELFTGSLHQATARAGLPAGCTRVASSATAAAAEVLAGQSLLLCDEPLARRHGLSWLPLADRSLDRGYEIGLSATGALGDDAAG
ncbi:MAG TPA: LysR family transcriptional regulator, partial [Streptosporangiaceae bacterium]|nr:LysR family transcriptional regulator [Streptosporangiaceae bacterium]